MKMKSLKIITTLLIAAVSNSLFAQIPGNPFAIYEFTKGSLENTSGNTQAIDLSGTMISVLDRNSNLNASEPSTVLTGCDLGINNVFNTTVSLWFKVDSLIQDQRIFQIYGNSSAGFRASFANGNELQFSASAAPGLSLTTSASDVVNIDYSQWHHLVITTESSVFNTLEFDMYLDNVLLPNISNSSISSVGTGTNIVTFLRSAVFKVNPTSTFLGEIDDIYIYNGTVLSTTEITELYNYYPPALDRAYVDIDATGNNDGTSWANAFTDLQYALNTAIVGTEVWVAEGVYKRQGATRVETFEWNKDSVKLYGGFSGTETSLSQRDWNANETILSGDYGVVGSNSDNAINVIVGPYGSATKNINYSTIDGFTIKDGHANLSTSVYPTQKAGGGFCFWDYVKKIELRNCNFKENVALNGAAIYMQTNTVNAEILIENCKIQDNTSENTASAIFIRSFNSSHATAKIINCLITDNQTNSLPSGTNQSTVFYFTEDQTGTTTVEIINSTITNNVNSYSGSHDVSTMLLHTNHNNSNGSVLVQNSIFWDNSTDDIIFAENSASSSNFGSVALSNSISDLTSTENYYTEVSVLTSDPLFTDASNGVYTLATGSPAIDAGNQTFISLTTDIAGNARVSGANIDMGCFEKQSSGGGSGSNSISKHEFENLKVFPNPSSGIVNIETNEIYNSIILKDITGKNIKQFDANSKRISVSEVSKGIYFLEIANNEKKTVVKLVVK